ncbi:hypothetical protein BD413DRAFT_269512 [Trametes elegans]|nr:hypothetical protein BD413DRAFT_269512 [Trametes elegans]
MIVRYPLLAFTYSITHPYHPAQPFLPHPPHPLIDRMPKPKGWYPSVQYEGEHFELKTHYDRETRTHTRNWVWTQGQVWDFDHGLYLPKAKSTGEKFPMVPPPAQPETAEHFRPADGDNPGATVTYGWTPEVGTRYCQHIHAYVPEHLPWKVGKLAPAAQKAPLRERLLTREFWHLPFAGEDSGNDEDGAAAAAGLEIKLVPAADGSAVHAEGLTYHQATLIPVHQAQKDRAIRYRSLTTTRPDLIHPRAAQWDNALRYRMVGGA